MNATIAKNIIENLAQTTVSVKCYYPDNTICTIVGEIEPPETNEDFAIRFKNNSGGNECKAFNYSRVKEIFTDPFSETTEIDVDYRN